MVFCRGEGLWAAVGVRRGEPSKHSPVDPPRASGDAVMQRVDEGQKVWVVGTPCGETLQEPLAGTGGDKVTPCRGVQGRERRD